MLYTLSAIVLSSQIALVSEVPPAARTTFAETWLQYAVSDRANCSVMATSGGTQSYVELMTCLQMAKEAKTVGKK